MITLVTPFTSWMAAAAPGNPIQQIANVHTVFNIVTTLLLLPFGTYMARLAVRILPESRTEEEDVKHLAYIAPFESNYPVGHSAVVISQVRQEVVRMLEMVKKNVSDSFEAVIRRDVLKMEQIRDREEYIDFLNAEISKYIVSLMTTEMSAQDSKSINGFYVMIGNIERLGDHAVNIAGYAKDLEKWGVDFSDNALEEIRKMKQVSMKTLEELDFLKTDEATRILEETVRNEQRIDDMQEKYLKKQIKRMQKGGCRAETGVLFSELLTDFERLGDHALNIAELYYEMES